MTTFRTTHSTSTCSNKRPCPDHKGISLRIGLFLAGVICFTVLQLYRLDDTKGLFLYEQYFFVNNHTRQQENENQQQDETAESSTPAPSPSPPPVFLLESFAISFDPRRVEKLQQRNAHAHLGKVLWVPGTDGLQQRTLDLWAQLTTGNSDSAMTLEQAAQLNKGDYRSPHAVGVYLSHWNLLRTLAHRPIELMMNRKQQQQEQDQHAYLILEDDATCAPGLDQEIAQTIKQLPHDWDILFVGGKPFSYFDDSNAETNNNIAEDANANKTVLLTKHHGKQLILDYKEIEAAANYTATAMTNQLIRHAVCQGDFGKARGPLAPDGSRRLSPDKTRAYWKVDYMTNTHSYVVNPHRVAHLSTALQPFMHVPVDVRLGDLIKSGQVNAYMTTRMWCDQSSSPDEALAAPQTWKGYFAFHTTKNHYDWTYIWQKQMHLDDAGCAF
jgi:GR25 family glycosyltransferase involved in LPS biosynthesis